MTRPWRPLRGVEPRFNEARLQAHHAAQWLARAARAYIPARDHDSHTNLGWDDALGGFATHALPDGARLGLQIAPLTLVLINADGRENMRTLALHGRRDADARAWFGEEMRGRGLDAGALDAALPYDLPAHAVAGGAAYATDGLGASLDALAAFYADAELALGQAREYFSARAFEAPPVRCWPHHFDLDTLISLEAGNARYVGAGFSPGDEYYDEPYFYVMPWPYPDVAAMPPLPEIGHWHTREFTAAIAPAHRFVAARDQQAASDEFLRAAIGASIAALR